MVGRCLFFLVIIMSEKGKAGRPSKYSQEIADAVCAEMIDGYDMIEACERVGVSKVSVWRWMTTHPEFEVQCARAREILTDVRLRRIRDKIKDAQDRGVDPALLRIEVSFEQWHAEKISPRYHQKLRSEVTGANGGPVQVQTTSVDVEDLSPEQREALRAAMVAAKAASKR